MSPEIWFTVAIATAIAAWPRTQLPDRMIGVLQHTTQVASCVLLLVAIAAWFQPELSERLIHWLDVNRFASLTRLLSDWHANAPLGCAAVLAFSTFLLRQQRRKLPVAHKSDRPQMSSKKSSTSSDAVQRGNSCPTCHLPAAETRQNQRRTKTLRRPLDVLVNQ